jgi:SPP1 gp7 family putative phage head morphogenesis protein
VSRPALSQLRFPKRPRTARRMRRQLQPDTQRLYYFSGVRALMAKAHALVTAELLPLVHELRGDARTDADEGERIRAKLTELAKKFARNVTPGALRPLVATVAQRTSDFQKTQLAAQLKDALGVAPVLRDADLAALAEDFTAENIALIRTVPERYFGELADVVTEAINAGSRASTIADLIEERYGVSETNAARIANDQVGKFFGDLNQTRQEELGITTYTWATAHDNRVRDNHEELDGTVQSWDVPPPGGGTNEDEDGHPGEGINCRCQALPDVDAFLDGL